MAKFTQQTPTCPVCKKKTGYWMEVMCNTCQGIGTGGVPVNGELTLSVCTTCKGTGRVFRVNCPECSCVVDVLTDPDFINYMKGRPGGEETAYDRAREEAARIKALRNMEREQWGRDGTPFEFRADILIEEQKQQPPAVVQPPPKVLPIPDERPQLPRDDDNRLITCPKCAGEKVARDDDNVYRRCSLCKGKGLLPYGKVMEYVRSIADFGSRTGPPKTLIRNEPIVDTRKDSKPKPKPKPPPKKRTGRRIIVEEGD